MKVLLSAYVCQPNQGSEKGFGWNWAISLAQMNHNVWVLTDKIHQEFIEKETKVARMSNLHFIFIESNKSVYKVMWKILLFINYPQLTWKYRYFRWQKKALKIATRLDRQFNFDIVHHVTWGSITAGSRLGNLDKPFIFGPIGGGQTAPPSLKKYFGNHWKQENQRTFVFKRLARFNLTSRKTLNQANLVLVTNRDTYKLAQQLGAEKVKLFLDTGLPQDFFPQKLPTRSTSQSKLNLLWVGSTAPRKGLHLTLESLSKVDPQIPFQIDVLGVDPLNNNLVESINEFDLEKKVRVLGRVSWQEVKNKYLQSDVFFFTSLRDSFGSQFVEAMAYGLPIITLNHHGARDFIPDNASIKVPVTNQFETLNALANGVEYLYNNPQKRLVMGRNGYEFAKKQRWSNKAARVTEYYEELMLPKN